MAKNKGTKGQGSKKAAEDSAAKKSEEAEAASKEAKEAEKDSEADAAEAAEPAAEEKPKAAAKAAHDEEKPKAAAKSAHDDHGHGPGAALPHGHHAPNRREYFYVFIALFVLTVLEVAVAQIPGISKVLMGIALVGLAVTKAACVGLFYMHLKHETKILRYTIAIPMATPAFYALVLITEGAWRLAR